MPFLKASDMASPHRQPSDSHQLQVLDRDNRRRDSLITLKPTLHHNLRLNRLGTVPEV